MVGVSAWFSLGACPQHLTNQIGLPPCVRLFATMCRFCLSLVPSLRTSCCFAVCFLHVRVCMCLCHLLLVCFQHSHINAQDSRCLKAVCVLYNAYTDAGRMNVSGNVGSSLIMSDVFPPTAGSTRLELDYSCASV